MPVKRAQERMASQNSRACLENGEQIAMNRGIQLAFPAWLPQSSQAGPCSG